MSIERQYNDVMLICDECGDECCACDSFNECLAQAKDDGWLITKDEDTDEWVHLCPYCANKLPKVS